MARLNILYKPHLTVSELTLPPGEEWFPQSAGWAIIQISSGTGFWLQSNVNRELETGTVLALSPQAQGAIRSSQLNGLSLHYFHVCPERLVGLMTMSEQRFFESPSFRGQHATKIFTPPGPVVGRMKELCAGGSNASGAAVRLQMLQAFIEIYGHQLECESPQPLASPDAKERLSEFLKRTPTSELLNISLAELVQITRCTPRHLSRIFREVVGMSYRDKQAELRLTRACKLLATTESKVVDVALESGYQSLSLFNQMFTRRFGLSPGRWRHRSLGKNKSLQSRRRALTSRWV